MDEETKKLLDGIDKRLALGEIDLSTYNELKSRFSARPYASTTEDPLLAAENALPKEARALKCPGCMAPLPKPADGATTITCEYCSGTFAIQTAADEMERLRKDVKSWMLEVASQGGGAGGSDEASRAFIFRNSIFPQMKLAADRSTEIYQPIRYLPLFSFSLLDTLGPTPFNDAVALTPNVEQLTGNLKGIVSRIQSPELVPFASRSREKADLRILEAGCLELAHLSNIRHGLQSQTPEGFQRVGVNLKALEKIYGQVIAATKGADDAVANFFVALVKRLGAVRVGAEALETLLKQSVGVAVDPFVERLDVAKRDCDVAVHELETCGREAKDTVPAAEGTRYDSKVLSILCDCVQLFRSSRAAESGVAFSDFLRNLEVLATSSAPSKSTIDWLVVFLENLARHLGAVEGTLSVPVLDSYSWVEAAAAGGVKAMALGGKVTYEVRSRILVPFWLAVIHFSEKSGALFWRKGESVEGYLLTTAASKDEFSFIEPGDTEFAKLTQAAIESPRSLAGAGQALAPIVGAENALRIMKNTLASSEKYKGSTCRLVGVIYLPFAEVLYKGKRGERSTFTMPGHGTGPISVEIAPLKIGAVSMLTAR